MAEASSSSAGGGSESSTKEKILELQSSDKTIFHVTEAEVKQSVVMKDLLELNEDTTKIEVKVNSHVLRKVIHYCKQHAKGPNTITENDLKEWDEAFMEALDKDTLFGITKAAHYLNVPGLTALTTQTLADNIKDMEPEDIRTYFNFSEDETMEAVKWANEMKAKMKNKGLKNKLSGHKFLSLKF